MGWTYGSGCGGMADAGAKAEKRRAFLFSLVLLSVGGRSAVARAALTAGRWRSRACCFRCAPAAAPGIFEQTRLLTAWRELVASNIPAGTADMFPSGVRGVGLCAGWFSRTGSLRRFSRYHYSGGCALASRGGIARIVHLGWPRLVKALP